MRALVCVDRDSRYEDVLNSLEWCLRMGSSPQDEVIVTHVVSPLRWLRSGSDDALGWAGKEREILESVDDFLSETARRLGERGIRASAARLEGDAAVEVTKAARERAARIIVLGALAETRSQGFLVGSVAEKVISLAETDVLIVRPRPHAAHPYRALLAVDGTLASEHAVTAFAERTRPGDATILIVHVLELPPAGWGVEHDVADTAPPALTDMADAAISRTQAILEEHGLDGKAEIRRGSVAGEILSAAEGFESDLIVVSTHSERHPSTSRFWRGSVMKRVVRHAACSVFVHNSRYEAEPTEP